jgi:hypothetical protein
MGAKLRIDRIVIGGDGPLAEHDVSAAADAAAERAQPVGRGRPVPGEAATLATGCRLAALCQRAFSVPSLCSRAFEVFCAAGNPVAELFPGACA